MRGQINLPVYGDYVGYAIKEVRMLAQSRVLCLRFSGGKDSIVMKWLLDQAGVPYQARFSRTSVDPPELLDFIRKYHPDVIKEEPPLSMFKLIVKKGFPPTRVCRYCCQTFKERNTCPKNRKTFTLTGIRKAESAKRRARSKWETCQVDKGVEFYHPIIDWTDEQLWNVIQDNRIPYCSLYDEGFNRIGCVGCPLTTSTNMIREFRRWPNFEKAYLWAFEKMLEGRQFDKWKTKYDVMEWYIYGVQEKYKNIDHQNEIMYQMSLNDLDRRFYQASALYSGDYYDNLPHEDDKYYHSIEDAKKILLT